MDGWTTERLDEKISDVNLIDHSMVNLRHLLTRLPVGFLVDPPVDCAFWRACVEASAIPRLGRQKSCIFSLFFFYLLSFYHHFPPW
jgi:hypothetical protein